jgi:Predicted membrane protein (DUF2127)
MSEPTPQTGPNPRLALAFLTGILALQGFYAGVETFRDGFDTSEPLQLVIGAAFFVYAGLIAAFAYGVWRRQPWARVVGMAAAGSGLAIAGLRIAGGDPVEQHILSIVIDGALLYYLTKPSIRELFER